MLTCQTLLQFTQLYEWVPGYRQCWIFVRAAFKIAYTNLCLAEPVCQEVKQSALRSFDTTLYEILLLLLPYLTLPYLTLPYLTLSYLTLPYLTLPYLRTVLIVGFCIPL